MAEVGYVGLGVTGGGVAKRLLVVTGWNRTKDEARWVIDVPVPFSSTLEDATVPTAELIATTARELCGRG